MKTNATPNYFGTVKKKTGTEGPGMDRPPRSLRAKHRKKQIEILESAGLQLKQRELELIFQK